MFTAHNIYRHYLKKSEWKRASQLPAVCAFFERAIHFNQLLKDIEILVQQGRSTSVSCVFTLLVFFVVLIEFLFFLHHFSVRSPTISLYKKAHTFILSLLCGQPLRMAFNQRKSVMNL